MQDTQQQHRIRITLAVLVLVAIGFYAGFIVLMGTR